MAEPAQRIPRRALITRASGVALGAAVVWSAPSMRTTALGAGATGTPAPTPRSNPPVGSASGSATVGAPADPADPGTVGGAEASGGTLPLTGIDPKPLLIAGGGAILAGSALIASVGDTEPSRHETSR